MAMKILLTEEIIAAIIKDIIKFLIINDNISAETDAKSTTHYKSYNSELIIFTTIEYSYQNPFHTKYLVEPTVRRKAIYFWEKQ